VHTEKISLTALNSVGMLAVESVVDTRAPSVIQFVQGLRGELHVAVEEGTWAACFEKSKASLAGTLGSGWKPWPHIEQAYSPVQTLLPTLPAIAAW